MNFSNAVFAMEFLCIDDARTVDWSVCTDCYDWRIRAGWAEATFCTPFAFLIDNRQKCDGVADSVVERGVSEYGCDESYFNVIWRCEEGECDGEDVIYAWVGVDDEFSSGHCLGFGEAPIAMSRRSDLSNHGSGAEFEANGLIHLIYGV
jgi:hypothetical protein